MKTTAKTSQQNKNGFFRLFPLMLFAMAFMLSASFANPAVTTVTTAHADGFLKAGSVLDINVTYNESVTVGGAGTPTIDLNSSGTAVYLSGSPGAVLTFRYTVASGQNSGDLDYNTTNSLSITGATINDTATGQLPANNTLPAVGTFAGAHALVIDTIVPAVVAGVPANNTMTKNNNITFAMNYTELNRNTSQIFLNGVPTGLAPGDCGATNCTYIVLGMPDGVYLWNMSMNDSAGNTNFTETRLLTVDTTAPTVALNGPVDGLITNNNNITFNYTPTDNTASTMNCTIYRNASALGPFNDLFNGTADTQTYLGTADGHYVWSVNCTDHLSNIGASATRSFTIDTVLPVTTATANLSNGAAYTFNTWTNQSVNVTLACNDGSGSGCSVTLYCNDTNNTCTPSTPYSGVVQISTQGTSYIRYLSNDTAGNTEAVKNQTIRIDSIPPAVVINAPANNSLFNNATLTVNVTITEANVATVNISLINSSGATVAYNDTINANGTSVLTLTAPADGVYSVFATVADMTGLRANATNTNITVDTILSAPVFVSPPTPNDSVFISYNWSYILVNASEQLNQSKLEWNGTNVTMSVSGTTAYKNQTGLADGAYSYKVYSQDLAGNWNVTATRNLTVDSTVPSMIISVEENDTFYSTYGPNSVIHLIVNATDAISGIAYVTANFSNVSADCGGSGAIMNMTLGMTGVYNASCNVTADAAIADFAGGSISVAAVDNATNIYVSTFASAIILYNMTTPPNDPSGCMQWGGGTTDISRIDNFNDVNLVLVQTLYGNASCNGIELPWGNTTEAVAMLNFTSLNLSDPAVAAQLANLRTAINVSIPAPNSYQDARISVNTTAFEALNTTTKITFYGLPFEAQPAILDDAGSASGTGITWATAYEPSYGTFAGNLTFTVAHFSGYNVTDDAVPIITIAEPSDGEFTSDTAILLNMTVNGTGTQVSSVGVVITGTGTSDITSNLSCAPVSNGSELSACTMAANFSDGVFNISVTAFDYGAPSPGNNATASVVITVDTAAPATNASALDANASGYAFGTARNTANVSVNLTCSDGGAGCNTTYYCTDSDNTCAPSTVYTGTLSFSSEGTQYLRYYSSDNLSNNESVKNASIIIDRTNPALSIVSPANITYTSSSTVQLRYLANDSGSGLAQCKYQMDNSTPVNFTNCGNGTVSLSNGNHTVIFTATDLAGNENSSNVSFKVSYTSSGGDSGNGGNTGVIVPVIPPLPPANNSAPQENGTGNATEENATWQPPVNRSAEISNESGMGSGIYAVVISMSGGSSGPHATVTGVPQLPSNVSPVPPADGEVYMYLEIHVDVPRDNVSNATIRFTVPKANITDMNWDPASVKLYHYVDGVWTELHTRLVADDASYYYYEAETPGFSYFAIVGAPLAMILPENCLTLGCGSGYACRSVNGEYQCTKVEKPAAEVTLPVEPPKAPQAGDAAGAIIMLLAAVVALGIIGVGAYLFMSAKKGQPPRLGGDSAQKEYKFKGKP